MLRGGQLRFFFYHFGKVPAIVLFPVIFWFAWDTFFKILIFIFSCSTVSASNITLVFWWFPFLLAFWLLLDLVVQIPSVMCRSPLFITSMVHFFYAKFPFLYLDSIFIQFVSGFLIPFCFFGKTFDAVHVHQVIDLFLRFPEFLSGLFISKGYDLVASWLLQIVRVIVHIPWNMPLWIFTSAKILSPAVNSTNQVHGLLDKL